MSYENDFRLNEGVNRKNFRFWGSENPIEIREIPLHSERVTVWCAFMENKIIGPDVFDDCNGQAVTVNEQRYYEMLTDFLTPAMNEMNCLNNKFVLAIYQPTKLFACGC